MLVITHSLVFKEDIHFIYLFGDFLHAYFIHKHFSSPSYCFTCFTSSNVSPTLLSWPFLAVVAYIHSFVHKWIFMWINAYLCKTCWVLLISLICLCVKAGSIEWIAYQEYCAWRKLESSSYSSHNCCSSSSRYGPLWDSHILAGQLVVTLNTCQKSKVTKTLMQK